MIFAVFIVLSIVALDQLVKLWAVNALMGSEPIIIIPHVFQLTYIENRGAAFSFLQNQIVFFVIITLTALFAIAYVLRKKMIFTSLGRISLILVAGGAIGNLLDRVLRGYVVDMFYFNLIDFPVFNVADIFIVIGGIVFAYYLLVQHDAAKVNEESKE